MASQDLGNVKLWTKRTEKNHKNLLNFKQHPFLVLIIFFTFIFVNLHFLNFPQSNNLLPEFQEVYLQGMYYISPTSTL